MFRWVRNSGGSLVKVSLPQEPEAAVISNMDQMEHLEGEQHSQYLVEGNPGAYKSMRDYRHSPWVSAPFCTILPTNAPYGSAYNPSWGNHPNFSWKPRPPQYNASSSQPQPPQLTSPVEQAILNLSKLVGDYVEKKKTINAQLSQKIDTVENNVDKRIDGLQSKIDQKFDNLQKSILRLANQQHVYPEEDNPEEECLIDTMMEEHCQQQLQEGLIENFAEYSEMLSKSSDIGVVVCPWEKKEAISSLLTKESSGKEVVEEPQKPILKPLPPWFTASNTLS